MLVSNGSPAIAHWRLLVCVIEPLVSADLVVYSKLDVRRWMLEVRALARVGPVAQRLEQGTHNPLVPGSNPGGPSLRFGAPRKSDGCHAVVK